MRSASISAAEIALEETLSVLRRQLLASRLPTGHWVGELSSSALSTATAVCALCLVDRNSHYSLIRGGLDWLARNCNADAGWGDTVLSSSNVSTTALCWAAFGLAADIAVSYREILARTESWLRQSAGSLKPERLAK